MPLAQSAVPFAVAVFSALPASPLPSQWPPDLLLVAAVVIAPVNLWLEPAIQVTVIERRCRLIGQTIGMSPEHLFPTSGT
jgi:hypothetical protein